MNKIKKITVSSLRGKVSTARLGHHSFLLKKKQAEWKLRTGRINKVSIKELLGF